MKTPLFSPASLLLTFLWAQTPCLWAEGNPPAPDATEKAAAQDSLKTQKAEWIKRYDADGDGKLNDAERKALKNDPHVQDKKQEFIKQYDKDGDGKLAGSEKKAAKEALKTYLKEKRSQP